MLAIALLFVAAAPPPTPIVVHDYDRAVLVDMFTNGVLKNQRIEFYKGRACVDMDYLNDDKSVLSSNDGYSVISEEVAFDKKNRKYVVRLHLYQFKEMSVTQEFRYEP